MNHCGKPECPAAQELREALAEKTISPLAMRRGQQELLRQQAAVWDKLFSQILRVPA